MSDALGAEVFNEIEVMTLFVDDLAESKEFYSSVFQAAVVYEDDDSCVLDFGCVMVNLLQVENAPELVEPLEVGPMGTGPRSMLTIKVPDLDAACSVLRERGVELLNGPIDRPWGRRTAAFADPSGHVWEVAAEIS